MSDVILGGVFPGQGSQSVGMMSELVAQIPLVKKLFNEASQSLGYDLEDLVLQGPAVKLNQTEYTQPAMLAADIAMYYVWQHQGGAIPEYLAGHSLGEYAALVAAESLEFSQAIKLVSIRGRVMQAAVPDGTGAMAAVIGLDDERVAELCVKVALNEILAPANFNSPGQVVIAGHINAVNRAIIEAEQQGARLAKLIPVSVPCHCALLQPAVAEFSKALNSIAFKPPKIPVIANVDATIHTHPDAIRQNLCDHLLRPVHWVNTIKLMQQQGVNKLIEFGPGRVLTGMNKRITRDIKTYPIYDSATVNAALS